MVDNERFGTKYAVSGEAAFLAAEMEALGTDYQANGYTTRSQADEIGEDLGLGPASVLLDVGAGCGFPGLYLGARHGCAVVSLDPTVEGVRTATERAIADERGDRCLALVADAEAIPLRSRSIDAVVHADVLC